jgi:hypothetical protein
MRGAPIIIRTQEATPQNLRQIAFWDASTPSLVKYNTETVKGSGTNKLFLAYNDIYDVSAVDLTTGVGIAVDSSSQTNIIGTTLNTDRTHDYEVTYTVAKSFYAENNYIYDNGTQRTKLTFDKSPTDIGVTNYDIWYENNKHNPATPVSLPLHPFYTSIDEGFIFISHDEYSLSDSIEIRFSPSSITADGNDYIMMSFRTYDVNGNPKPNQTFNLTTDFGVIGNETVPTSSTTVTTNEDGFAAAPIGAGTVTTTSVGTVTITGAISTAVTFDIIPTKTDSPELIGTVTSDRIPSDGYSQVYVFGRFLNPDRSGVDSQAIQWRKGRHVYDVFQLARSTDTATPGYDGNSGQVTTKSDGTFAIGPFVAATPSEPGYWFVAVEGMYDATPLGGGDATPEYAGDMVFWQEYPDPIYGVENLSGIPRQPVQFNEWWDIPEYATPSRYPVYYDEATPQHATPNDDVLIWEPPRWYAIDRYQQYQLGFLGTEYYQYDYGTAQSNQHPDYKDK